jgi:hypothetical protein
MASISTMKMGAMMGEGEGKRRGLCLLRGGEGVDGEAAGHGDALVLGCEVEAATYSGKEKGGCRGGSGRPGGRGPRGVEVAGPSGRTRPKRWVEPIWLLELKQRKNFFLDFKLNYGI